MTPLRTQRGREREALSSEWPCARAGLWRGVGIIDCRRYFSILAMIGMSALDASALWSGDSICRSSFVDGSGVGHLFAAADAGHAPYALPEHYDCRPYQVRAAAIRRALECSRGVAAPTARNGRGGSGRTGHPGVVGPLVVVLVMACRHATPADRSGSRSPTEALFVCVVICCRCGVWRGVHPSQFLTVIGLDIGAAFMLWVVYSYVSSMSPPKSFCCAHCCAMGPKWPAAWAYVCSVLNVVILVISLLAVNTEQLSGSGDDSCPLLPEGYCGKGFAEYVRPFQFDLGYAGKTCTGYSCPWAPRNTNWRVVLLATAIVVNALVG